MVAQGISRTRFTDPVLCAVFRRFPPKRLIFTGPEGRADTEYDQETAWPFFWWFNHQEPSLFRARHMLDLGSGYGGRTIKYLEYGANSVVGVEITDKIVSSAQEFAVSRGASDLVSFRLGTGEAIPADDGEFDLVVMFDVLEHVISPEDTLRECYRVLSPGGVLACVFPPYYAIRCGSHLTGYATKVWGLNVIFSTRILRSATTRHLDEQGHDWHAFLRDVPTDKLWNMNGLTVARFEQLVDAIGFERQLDRRISHFEVRRHEGRARGLANAAYWGFWILAQPPGLRELFCERVCALLAKPVR